MCGFAGYWDHSGRQSNEELLHQATVMAETLWHRGPDHGGAWADAEVGIAFGFRRLSVVDLSTAGHQPMHSANGHYVVVFNGEIYNFKSLRRDLEDHGHVFRGHSDTEVLLAAVSEWGLESSVKRFDGMFAFALWDCKRHQLHLVRDRLGEKPLYYGWVGKTLLFGSELKALRAYPGFAASINHDSLLLYLRYGCIPTPYSIYTNFHKVPLATILSIRLTGAPLETRSSAYWSAKESALRGVAEPFQGSAEDAVVQLDRLLRDSVKLRMLADVPVGAFLSGGIDSSTVVSMMQAEAGARVKTFSIGFQPDSYNEAVHAKRVAEHLGTTHNEFFVTAEEAMAVIPKLPCIYDEPFADSSQIPTFLISRWAREHVTVSLSGDGGDELFGGYNRHSWVPRIWSRLGWLPKGIRRMMAALLNTLAPQVWETFFETMGPHLLYSGTPVHPGDKLQKLAEVLTANDPKDIYLGLVSHTRDPGSLLVTSAEAPDVLRGISGNGDFSDITLQMMYLDMVTYLPDDILVKLDRASMASSLEARVPLLDHRLVEFAWTLPLSLKIRGGHGKWILRQVLHKYVPENLLKRPKSGFAIPLHQWLRGPLREWAESLLDERRLRHEGFLAPKPIRQKWEEHLSGKRNWQYQLWDALMFEAWLDAQKH
jgi:asparagine synthase (glutamine-hydrolysing)